MGSTLSRTLLALALAAVSVPGFGATISFMGPLRFVEDTSGGTAVYSGVAPGTVFSGEIDDVTASGFISDGTTVTTFSCCTLAAGGLELSNDVLVDAESAALFNELWGTTFTAGDRIDLIDLEGDSVTAGGGRIEVGLSFGLVSSAFDDESLANYPPDPADILGIAFFIAEFDAAQQTIYDGLGPTVVPLPAAVWLLGGGIAGLAAFRRRRPRVEGEET